MVRPHFQLKRFHCRIEGLCSTRTYKLLLQEKKIKLPANSSYCYQNIDGSRVSVTKYLLDEKTYAAIKNKVFEGLALFNDKFCQVELVKSEIESEEPMMIGFLCSMLD